MKKSFCISLIFSLIVFSVEADNLLLDDFEAGDKGWAPVNEGWVDFQIVNNPQHDALNSSAKVMKIVRHTGTQTWAGIILRNKMSLSFGSGTEQYRYAKVKMLKSTNGKVTFKLETNGDAGSFSNSQNYIQNANWQSVIFDLAGVAGKSYDDFFIMPDQTENPAQEITVYIDDIEFLPGTDVINPDDLELPGVFQLVWADEFDGTTYADSIWSPQIAGDGFGNNELQYYTGNANNIFIRNGNLVIKAISESYQNRGYTSGKLWSQNKKYFKYGRVEARFKLPKGRGTWPAIWMMPQNSAYGGWPNSGEIDIMEFVGYDANKVYGTVHRGTGSGDNGDGGNINVPNADNFHIIRIDWEPGYIKWYLDDQLFHTYYNAFNGSAQWPFDQPFYVILNFAIGGNWGGAQGVDNSIFPQEFLIDYVRVYQKKDLSGVENIAQPKEVFITSPEENILRIKTEKYPLILDVFSLSGQKYLSENINATETNINISALPAGAYIISVKNEQKQTFVQKIIK